MKWDTTLKVKQSLSISSAARHPVLKAARDPSRADAAPRLTMRPLATHTVTKGFDFRSSIPHAPPPSPVSPRPDSEIPSSQPSSSGINITAPAVNTGSDTMDIDTSTVRTFPQTADIATMLACERVANEIARTKTLSKPPAVRKPRTCFKCRQPDCKGKRSAKSCQNACRDCGQRACRGRNSRHPTKPCHTAWEDTIR